MGKKIHLIRHAKSSWKDGSLTDFDRPLNRRGVKSCELMAPAILNAGCYFENVYVSPAKRAQLTITIINKALDNTTINWCTVPDLYTFDSNDLFRFCLGLHDSIDELVIVGHNPAFTEFCNRVSNSTLANIPTCGYVALNTSMPFKWPDLMTQRFTLTSFIQPKDPVQ